MTDDAIEREVVIDAPVDEVWAAITEPDQMARWLADRAELDLRPGGTGILVFGDRAATHGTTAPIEVHVVDPPRRVSFRWGQHAYEAPAPGNSLLLEFTLSAEDGDRTRVRVTESELDVIDWPDEEKVRYADDHRKGWELLLGRLAALFAVRRG